MKNAGFWLCCGLVVAGLGLLSGCSKKADEGKPISEVKAEAEQMDVDALRAQAVAFKDSILAKQKDLEKINEQLKQIPVTELLGEKAKTLKTEVETVTKSLSALKERFDVYVGKLKEKKGDLSGLDIKL